MKMCVLTLALAGAGLLAACGGGGDSNSDSGRSGGTANKVTLTGVASKGLMANALVSAHSVKSDGSVDLATVLASTTTDASGNYSLSFDGTQGVTYVVRVTAKSDGSTTHLDEVSGQAAALPDGFTMRTLFTPTSSGTVTTSASITPFSEMAVSAAEKASGGITSVNATQAVSTVTQLLGFNPSSVTPRTTGTASSADEQKLAVLLTAVSQLANEGALGCAAGTAGEKTKCVVDALADSASTSTIKLESTSGSTTTDVSAVLEGAVVEVLSDSALSGSVSSATLTTVLSNLGCSGTSCTAASSGSGSSNPIATAIASAKTLFAQLKSDWSALFSRGGATSLATGAANVEAYKISQAMTGIEVPVEVLAKDLGALLMGADLYADYKAGRTTINARGRGPEPSNDGSANFSNATAVGCTVYNGTVANASSGTPATSAATAGSFGCSARYFLSRSVSYNLDGSYVVSTTQWRHGFSVLPNADGSYSYTNLARRSVFSQTCTTSGCGASTQTVNEDLQGREGAPFSGTLTPTLDASGNITAFTATGSLAAAFKSGANTLANDHHTWSLTGTTSKAADGLTGSSVSTIYSVTGNIVAYSDTTTAAGTLAVKTGTLASSDLWLSSSESNVLTGADFDLTWTTTGAEFEGRFAASDVKLDKSGAEYAPTRALLSGTLRSINGGVTTEVLNLTATGTSAGYEDYDATVGLSDSNNRFTVGLSVVGTVTAPSRPKLEFTLGMSKYNNVGDINSLTLQYRSLASDGTVRQVVNGTASRTTVGGPVTYRLSEASANLSMSWVDSPSTAALTYGTTTIGTIDARNKSLTFSDGSLMSLDIGL